MINGVVAQKPQTLEEVLAELRSLGRLQTDALASDWRTRRAVERDLQILVEIMIDICSRLLALDGQAPPSTAADAVARCVQLGALRDQAPYRRMVQFRNFIVHRYERVDIEILVDIVNRRLPDVEQFRNDILAYVRRSEVSGGD